MLQLKGWVYTKEWEDNNSQAGQSISFAAGTAASDFYWPSNSTSHQLKGERKTYTQVCCQWVNEYYM